jgi:hypothetical protein
VLSVISQTLTTGTMTSSQKMLSILLSIPALEMRVRVLTAEDSKAARQRQSAPEPIYSWTIPVQHRAATRTILLHCRAFIQCSLSLACDDSLLHCP